MNAILKGVNPEICESMVQLVNFGLSKKGLLSPAWAKHAEPGTSDILRKYQHDQQQLVDRCVNTPSKIIAPLLLIQSAAGTPAHKNIIKLQKTSITNAEYAALRKAWVQLSREITGTPYDTSAYFDFGELLHATMNAMVARDSLTQPSPISPVIATLMARYGSSYFLEGYPSDLLVMDRLDAELGATQIAVKKAWLSTQNNLNKECFDYWLQINGGPQKMLFFDITH